MALTFTDIPGVRVGHWTNAAARTGCTVVLLPDGTIASGEVRGGAPATREVALLEPTRTVPTVHAVVLTGGSAFGLAACDGVVRYCEEEGRGVPTPGGAVPIVVGFGLYDLGVGDPSVRPGAPEGYAAAQSAADGPPELGLVGAGTGATVGDGAGGRRPGGIASTTVSSGELVVGALVVGNAFGVPGADDEPGPSSDSGLLLGNTTIGVIVTNARLDKVGCNLVAQSAHDGLARAVYPAHTRYDGDAFVAASTGTLTSGADHLDQVRALATHAVAESLRSLA
jgi:L-aminopeptidase/D-esterase-like protein